MDERVKALWIDALESGEYKQGRGELRKTDELTGEHSYCCLGVLCDLYSKETGEQWSKDGSMRKHHSFPSPEVEEWAGLSHKESVGIFGDENVVDHNDVQRSSFAEIAQIIRNNA